MATRSLPAAGGLFVALFVLPVIGAFTPAGAQLKNLFGGEAKVSLDVPDLPRGTKATLTVNMTVSSKPITLRRLYVKVRGKEDIAFNYVVSEQKDDKGKVISEKKAFDVKKEDTIFEKEFTIVTGQELAAGSHHSFKGEVDIPAHLPPSYKGKYSQIRWEAQAGTDLPGIGDPSTDWQVIEVK